MTPELFAVVEDVSFGILEDLEISEIDNVRGIYPTYKDARAVAQRLSLKLVRTTSKHNRRYLAQRFYSLSRQLRQKHNTKNAAQEWWSLAISAAPEIEYPDAVEYPTGKEMSEMFRRLSDRQVMTMLSRLRVPLFEIKRLRMP